MTKMHKLWIMRHGQAMAQASSDEQRALTAVGEQQVLQSAKQHLINSQFTHVFVSPYLRAQQTWHIIKPLVHADHCETVNWITPDVATAPALDALLSLSGNELRVLLVCHQTFAGRLSTHLCEGSTQGKHLETAAIEFIETEVFASKCGHLLGSFCA